MKLGIIGCGKMGTALAAGVLRSQLTQSDRLIGYDVSAEARLNFTNAIGAPSIGSASALNGYEVLILATKPQYAAEALSSLSSDNDSPGPSQLLISIAAGLDLPWLMQHAPEGWRIIRCMPNTPALIGEGVTAFCASENATSDDLETANKIFSSLGSVHEVPEKQLDAITGLSGSGPAYAFLMIEALADGAVKEGLPRPLALELAARTLRGAASMVLQTGQHPAQLKDQVASPGGTTIAGLASLEKNKVRAALIEAVTAAASRSRELGNF